MVTIHKTADVSKEAKIGDGTTIWNWTQVREKASIGKNCVISKGVYIDHDVKIGNNVKIQNNVSIYFDAELEDGVFVAPHACFTNDKLPRAINPDGSLKSGGSEGTDWKIQKTIVREGAAIGANSTILSGLEIGKWALVAAGAIVTKSVPDYGLVVGCPAKLIGFVSKTGNKLKFEKEDGNHVVMKSDSGNNYQIPKKDYDLIGKK